MLFQTSGLVVDLLIIYWSINLFILFFYTTPDYKMLVMDKLSVIRDKLGLWLLHPLPVATADASFHTFCKCATCYFWSNNIMCNNYCTCWIKIAWINYNLMFHVILQSVICKRPGIIKDQNHVLRLRANSIHFKFEILPTVKDWWIEDQSKNPVYHLFIWLRLHILELSCYHSE